MEAQATNAQQELFRQWAEGTDFILDLNDRPKRQFNILAKLLGWASGGEPWNANWQKCFDEEYIWRGVRMLSAAAAQCMRLKSSRFSART